MGELLKKKKKEAIKKEKKMKVKEGGEAVEEDKDEEVKKKPGSTSYLARDIKPTTYSEESEEYWLWSSKNCSPGKRSN